MIYLTGVTSATIEAHAAEEPRLGLMAQPGNGTHRRAHLYLAGTAYDNGAYGAHARGLPFDEAAWLRGLDRINGTPLLFAVAPDAIGDHNQTLKLWRQHAHAITDHGHPAAFVLQNGCTRLEQIPDDAAAVFVGGDTDYKLSNETARLTWATRASGRHVHMGRVNSGKRLARAYAMGCDSADGTLLRFGNPTAMLARLTVMLDELARYGAQLDALDHTDA